MLNYAIEKTAIFNTQSSTVSREEFESLKEEFRSYREWVQEEFQKKDQRIKDLEQQKQSLERRNQSLRKIYIASVQYILNTPRCLSKDGHLFLYSKGELLYMEE